MTERDLRRHVRSWGNSSKILPLTKVRLNAQNQSGNAGEMNERDYQQKKCLQSMTSYCDASEFEAGPLG